MIPIGGYGGGPVALAESGPVGAQNERQVCKDGDRPSQGAVEKNLLGGVRDVVGATDDMADVHVQIIQHHAQVVGGHAIGPNQHEVFDLLGSVGDPAEDPVLESNFSIAGRLEANHAGQAAGTPLSNQIRRQVSTGAVILPGFSGGGCRLPFGRQLGRRAETAVGLVFAQELLYRLAVALQPLRLQERALVPTKAQPLEGAQDVFHHLRAGALPVGIFNAEDEASALASGEQPVEQGGTRPAHVQGSGGGRCKAYSHTRQTRTLHVIVPIGKEVSPVPALPCGSCRVKQRRFRQATSDQCLVERFWSRQAPIDLVTLFE